MLRTGILLLLWVANISPLAADDIHLLINGRSIHLEDRENYNEDNAGLGLQYDFDTRGDWVNLVNFSTFKDSNNETSRYVGAGTKLRGESGGSHPLHLDVGVFAFLMTRKDYNNNDPFFGLLPFLSFGSENVGINVTYIPAVSEELVDVIYIQAMVRFGGD